MRRNAIIEDTSEGSFAALLDHLTGHTRPESVVPTPEADFPSRTGLDSASSKPSGIRASSRTLPPVTEWRAGRDSSVADGMPLSYEQALRIHARRRTAPIADLDTLPAAHPELPKSDLSKSAVEVPARSQKMPPGKNHISQQAEDLTRSRTRTKAATAAVAIRKPLVKIGRHSPTSGKTQASTQKAQKPGRKSSPASALRPKPAVEVSASSRRRAGTSGNATPAPKTVHRTRETSRSTSAEITTLTTTAGHLRSLATLENTDLQPGLDLDQRRATVSLRLTDAEFLRLKDRASESGISVSAYMRSCILDADQLRSQVKQALAQMRALSASSEPSFHAALPLPKERNDGRQWFQLLLRSATFVMGSWFRFGRSA